MNTAGILSTYIMVAYLLLSVVSIVKGAYDQKLLIFMGITAILIAATALSASLIKDLYNYTYQFSYLYDNRDDPYFSRFSIIRSLLVIGLTSILKLFVRPGRNSYNNTGATSGMNPYSQSSSYQPPQRTTPKVTLGTILNNPIVNIISLISSILGIISFYIDYFAKK